MIHQPQVRLLIHILFYGCQGAVDGVEDTGQSDVVRQQREVMVMEPVVMEKVHGIVDSCCDVECRRGDVI